MVDVVVGISEVLENLSWSLGGVLLGIAGTAAYAKATGQSLDFSLVGRKGKNRNRLPKKIR